MGENKSSTSPAPWERGRWAASAWITRLAFRSSPGLLTLMVLCALLAATLPAAAAWVARLIVDGVADALRGGDTAWRVEREHLIGLIALEALLISMVIAAQRGLSTCQSMLRTSLGNRVTDLVLVKSAALDLAQFEDPDVHEQLLRARRDASTRPVSLVMSQLTVLKNVLALTSCVVLLAPIAQWWTIVIVLFAGLPAFVAEIWFSSHAWERQKKRSAEWREQHYLETVLAREDFAKEIKLWDLHGPLLARHRDVTARLEKEERAITLRRNLWGFVLNVLGTALFYGAYVWIVRRTVNEHLTLGQMTMYLAIFRQAQAAVTSALATLGLMLDDHLYVIDLRALLGLPTPARSGTATKGPDPEAGIVVDDVSFTYPGGTVPALDHVSLRIRPGEMLALVGQNGSGKTTLLKLITRLYELSEGSGRILVDGLDVREWEEHALRRRFALVFQDFARFKLTAGENIGAGDAPRMGDVAGIERAAQRAGASELLASLPEGVKAPLGKWFRGGRELSGGQWQSIALARAFMREEGQVLVLDEPFASLDPEAEARIFAQVKREARERIVLFVSHRFGAVRHADRIVMLEDGHVHEEGTHDELVEKHGLYARLFDLQASGYRSSSPSPSPTPEREDAAE